LKDPEFNSKSANKERRRKKAIKINSFLQIMYYQKKIILQGYKTIII